MTYLDLLKSSIVRLGRKKTLKGFFFSPSSMWASCSSQRSLSCEPVIMFGFGSYSSLSPDPLPPLRSLPLPPFYSHHHAGK